MQDIFLDHPNGVKWSTLNLSEKYHLKQRFFNGDGVSDSKEISMNCRNQLKAMGFKKTFCPTHGKKFRVTIPIIKTFLKNYYYADYYLSGVRNRAIENDPSLPFSLDLHLDENNFEELLDFCQFFPHFYNRFYLENHLQNITKSKAIRIMKNHRKIYRVLPDHLKSDRTILQLALRSPDCNLLAYAPPNVLNSNNYFQLAVSKYIDALVYFSDNILNRKKNIDYIESQLYKIKHNRTINKLPKSLVTKYFDCFQYFECNSYHKIGRLRSKNFPVKMIVKYSKNLYQFKTLLNWGSSNTKTKLKRIINFHDYKNIPGEYLLEIINNLVEWGNHAEKHRNEFTDYLNYLCVRYDLIPSHSGEKLLIKKWNIFAAVTFENDLDLKQLQQIQEIDSFLSRNPIYLKNLKNTLRTNLRFQADDDSAIPF